MGGRDIQPLVMCGRCKFEGQMEKVGRWWWGIYPGAQICGLIVYLSDQCQNPAQCYHVAIVLCRDTVGRHARAAIAVTTPSQPPHNRLNPLSVRRLAGRNQTFTTRAPPAVVLLPQLINNRRTIVDGRERTGSRIARNSLNPATSSSLPRNCEFRFLVSSSNLSGKIVGLAPGKPVKACLCPSLPDIYGHHVERQTWLL